VSDLFHLSLVTEKHKWDGPFKDLKIKAAVLLPKSRRTYFVRQKLRRFLGAIF